MCVVAGRTLRRGCSLSRTSFCSKVPGQLQRDSNCPFTDPPRACRRCPQSPSCLPPGLASHGGPEGVQSQPEIYKDAAIQQDFRPHWYDPGSAWLPHHDSSGAPSCDGHGCMPQPTRPTRKRERPSTRPPSLQMGCLSWDTDEARVRTLTALLWKKGDHVIPLRGKLQPCLETSHCQTLSIWNG
eukprot:396079-Rhodomonas_salina.1